VFVAGVQQESERAWRCAIDAPSTHPRIAGAERRMLPVIVALEMQRQCGYVAAHQLGVPFGWRFVILEFGVRWLGRGPRLSSTGFQGDMTVDVDVTHSWQGKPRRVEYGFLLSNAEGEPVGSGRGLALCLDPSRYAVMRQRSASVTTHETVASMPGELVPVHWNDEDRFLFNRPDDHVVSMALLDAFLNEISGAVPAGAVDGIDTQFRRFGESAGQIWLSISRDAATNMAEGIFVQDQAIIAHATATLNQD
jgi:hypothetical protein